MPSKRRVEGLKLGCSHCGRMLPRGWFRVVRQQGRADRRDSWCRECRAPGKAVRNARRRERAQGRGSFTVQDIEMRWRQQFGMCAICSVSLVYSGYHVDHVVALARGGSNMACNIQLLCPRCNLRKGAK